MSPLQRLQGGLPVVDAGPHALSPIGAAEAGAELPALDIAMCQAFLGVAAEGPAAGGPGAPAPGCGPQPLALHST